MSIFSATRKALSNLTVAHCRGATIASFVGIMLALVCVMLLGSLSVSGVMSGFSFSDYFARGDADIDNLLHRRIELLGDEIARVRQYEHALQERAEKLDLLLKTVENDNSPIVISSKRFKEDSASQKFLPEKSLPMGGGEDVTDESFEDIVDSALIVDDTSGHIIRPLPATLDRLIEKLTVIPMGIPVEGKISSRFGFRRNPFNRRKRQMHNGLDVVAPWRTPIKATAPGVVKKASWYGGYGRTVIIDHGDGYETRFAHLSKIKVKVGQQVLRGDVVGLLGSTGRSTGAHLHYEVRRGGKATNPAPFIDLARALQDAPEKSSEF